MRISFALPAMFCVAPHPAQQLTAAVHIQLAFNLVKPRIDALLLGHQSHQQAVMVQERSNHTTAYGHDNGNDCNPIAHGQFYDVVPL
jgi:hypothetical protein